MSTENPLDSTATESTTEATTTETTTETTPNSETVTETNALYGDLNVEWPEGTEDYLMKEPSIKPFVGKDGKLNNAALLKSYHETKKSYGKDRALLPDENSSEEQISEFWNKLGASSEIEDYNQELEEGATLKQPFMDELKKFAHENRLPVETVKKLTGFIDGQAKLNDTTLTEVHNATIVEGLEKVKVEYGQAYESNINLAKKVLDTFATGDEREIFNNPAIGANPAVIKTLVNIGKKMFSEGTHHGESRPDGALSPEDAQEAINTVMGDKNHPFFNKNHPNHKIANAKMLKLYEMKRG